MSRTIQLLTVRTVLASSSKVITITESLKVEKHFVSYIFHLKDEAKKPFYSTAT